MEGEFDGEGRSLFRATFDGNPPSVVFDGASADREPQSCSPGFRRKKEVEDPVLMPRGDPAPGVADSQLYLVGLALSLRWMALGSHGHGPLGGSRFEGVLSEIQDA